VWTLIVPILLGACIYVVAAIVGGARWTWDFDGTHPASGTLRSAPAPARWHVTKAGDTWRSVAAHAHVSSAQLHRLNPRDSAKGKLVPGERLLLRP
jgi:LysM repeat protein